MKKILIAQLLIVPVTAMLVILALHLPERPSALTTSHTGPTIEQIRQLASLVTTKVETADVQEKDVRGYTGQMRVALLVKGDFLLSVDLSQARYESIEQDARQAVLVLPAPAALSPRVDHQRTRLYQVTSEGLWMIVPGDQGRSQVIEQAYREAQDTVATVAADPKLIDQSRRRAEEVLATFFAALDWKVTVHWAS